MFKKPTLNINLKYKTKILIIGVADYENLGDHASGYAQRLFLNSISIDTQKYEIIEVPLNTPVNHISQIINPKDTFPDNNVILTQDIVLSLDQNFNH